MIWQGELPQTHFTIQLFAEVAVFATMRQSQTDFPLVTNAFSHFYGVYIMRRLNGYVTTLALIFTALQNQCYSEDICPESKLMQMGNMCIWTGRGCTSGNPITLMLAYCGASKPCNGAGNPAPCVQAFVDKDGTPLKDRNGHFIYNQTKDFSDEGYLYVNGEQRFHVDCPPIPQSVKLSNRFRELSDGDQTAAPAYFIIPDTKRGADNKPYVLRLNSVEVPSQPTYHTFSGWEVESLPIHPPHMANVVSWKKTGNRTGLLIVKGHDLMDGKPVDAHHLVPFVISKLSDPLPGEISE